MERHHFARAAELNRETRRGVDLLTWATKVRPNVACPKCQRPPMQPMQTISHRITIHGTNLMVNRG